MTIILLAFGNRRPRVGSIPQTQGELGQPIRIVAIKTDKNVGAATAGAAGRIGVKVFLRSLTEEAGGCANRGAELNA